MDKDVVCVFTMGYCSATLKNETVPFAGTGMDLQMVTVSKMSQRKKNATGSLIKVQSEQ